MTKIHALITPNSNRRAKYEDERHLGHGGLRHPRHIAEFNKMTECSMIKETENGILKLEAHSQSSRRHIQKKTENRKWRNGVKKQSKKLIEEALNY